MREWDGVRRMAECLVRRDNGVGWQREDGWEEGRGLHFRKNQKESPLIAVVRTGY